MFGRILCCSFKPISWGVEPKHNPPYTFRGDDRKYRVNGDVADDSKLAVAIRNELESADLLVAWNGILFDYKFLNARLFRVGERPREARWTFDPMWTVRSNIRCSSKLDNVAQFLDLTEQKTGISWPDWLRGAAFDKKAMDVIVEHCEADVKVLEQAYWRLLPYQKALKRR